MTPDDRHNGSGEGPIHHSHYDAQDNRVVIGRYTDIGIGPAVIFDGGGFTDAKALNAFIADLAASAKWLEGRNR